MALLDGVVELLRLPFPQRAFAMRLPLWTPPPSMARTWTGRPCSRTRTLAIARSLVETRPSSCPPIPPRARPS
eukprot:1819664-Pyramimonas_sp.AAC.1